VLRLGFGCLGVFVGIFVLGIILDGLHLIASGPCAGPGRMALYVSLALSGSFGILFVLLGAGKKLYRKITCH